MSLIVDYKRKMGEITVLQKIHGEEVPLKMNIYWCNGLAAIVYEYTEEGKEMVMLYTFFADEQHIKNIVKDCGHIIGDKIKSVKLNMYYKECSTLLKYFVRECKVECFYKEPTKTK